MMLLLVISLSYFDTCALPYEERSRPSSQKQFMTPHEKMATKRYHQKTTRQKQEESFNRFMKKQDRMEANFEPEEPVAERVKAEDDADSNRARDELLAGVVTMLNATVRHESGLEKEVTKLRKAEKKLQKEVGEIERKESLLLWVAALAFVTVTFVAVLRWCRNHSMA